MNEPDKSRNVMASPWRQQSRHAISAKYFLGWFTVPIEVLFRRNFGRRWLTIRNFLAGFIILIGFTGLQILYVWLWQVVPPLLAEYDIYHWKAPSPKNPSWQFILDYSMTFFLMAYVLLAMVHFFMIWWRDRSRTAKFSYDDGTPWLMPIGFLFAKILYLLTWPILRIFMTLFVRGGWKKRTPQLIEDYASFTKIIIEPLALAGLVLVFSGPTRLWLAISAIAIAIYSAEKKRFQMNKMRDIRDGGIQAQEVERQHAKAAAFKTQKQRKKIRLFRQEKRTRSYTDELAPQYPDLEEIIEEMHREKGNRA